MHAGAMCGLGLWVGGQMSPSQKPTQHRARVFFTLRKMSTNSHESCAESPSRALLRFSENELAPQVQIIAAATGDAALWRFQRQ